MLVDDLIKILKAMRRDHGNLPVRFDADGVKEVAVYTEHGHSPSRENGKATEIFLH